MFRHACIICCILFWLPCTVAHAQDLGLPDIYSIVQQNSRAPRTIRVAWRVEKATTKEGRNFHAAVAASVTEAFAKGLIEAGKQDSFRAEQETHRALSISERREFAFLDYWTDFTSFQMRAVRSPESGAPFGFSPAGDVQFPDYLPNGEELASGFQAIQVLSHGPATDGRFRLWQAGRQPPYSGRVGLTSAWFGLWHIPLVMPPSDWGGKLHPIDEFFALLAEGKGHVIGSVSLGGKPVWLVFVSNGQMSMRAFLDLDAGAIPRRLERFPWDVTEEQGRYFAGLCEERPLLTADIIVRDIEISTFSADDHQYFYPVSGVVCNLSKAASANDALSAAQPEIAVHDTTTWRVELVECNREMDQADFRLTFPPHTVYVDDALRETFVTGDLDGEVARLADSAIRFGSTRSSPWVLWSAGGAVFLGAVALAFFLLRRHRI